MKILVTGAGGRLGAQIVSQAEQKGLEVDPLSHHAPAHRVHSQHTIEMLDPEAIKSTVERSEPDWIIHTAAMTDVDSCERDPDLAFKMNSHATRALGESAKRIGARFVYISTDYVFNGRKGQYVESDPLDPINHYGKSKAEGEKGARSVLPDALIVRPSVLFGPGKADFVQWVMRSLREESTIRLAVDQIVSPTYTPDLASQILELVRKREQGVWHTAGPQPLSRFEMGTTIAALLGVDREFLKEARCEDLPWVAARPKNSSLDVSKIQRIHPARTFSEGVQDLLAPQRENERRTETVS